MTTTPRHANIVVDDVIDDVISFPPSRCVLASAIRRVWSKGGARSETEEDNEKRVSAFQNFSKSLLFRHSNTPKNEDPIVVWVETEGKEQSQKTTYRPTGPSNKSGFVGHGSCIYMEGEPERTSRDGLEDERVDKNGKPLFPRRFVSFNIESYSEDQRLEWIALLHDSVLNPSRCWQIEIYWLVCSGAVVDDFVKHFGRKAAAQGLSFMQLPVERTLETADPFHSPLNIAFPKSIGSSILHEALVHHFNFVINSETSEEEVSFVHRSGGALVTLRSDSLQWDISNLACHRSAARMLYPVYLQVHDLCSAITSASNIINDILKGI
eukprot:CAMPEP_0184346006 /NCGR_PEP_ID=MMETSP1089-20130417/14336_1 /TAXON_ID=38269 ORGANISM="Gloeochaete wittrockiana, Strain SAG46.84" /NCGR_SAMPLE_ID=MMETSP1089 /ASSEMBLY_ACC=CAM_ASM_000445 /LENGTH=323 /DNA_ID=CAMNT_0026676523 /DNA_START=395 /DNA_END=1366 /DNA_ORIENTATION=-